MTCQCAGWATLKVLTVDVARRRLVTCGSVFQGTCQLRPVDNISHALEPDSRGNTDYFVAANDPRLSTMAFVAPGPGHVDALYVAATYTGTAATAVRQAVPAVSVRALGDNDNAFRSLCTFWPTLLTVAPMAQCCVRLSICRLCPSVAHVLWLKGTFYWKT